MYLCFCIYLHGITVRTTTEPLKNKVMQRTNKGQTVRWGLKGTVATLPVSHFPTNWRKFNLRQRIQVFKTFMLNLFNNLLALDFYLSDLLHFFVHFLSVIYPVICPWSLASLNSFSFRFWQKGLVFTASSYG